MGCLVSAIFFTLGLAVLFFQTYLWLRFGEWLGISVIDGLKYFISPTDWPWLWNPNDWIGLYNLVDKTPLFLFFWLVGFLALMAWEESLE